MKSFKFVSLGILVVTSLWGPAQAQINIEITQGVARGIPVAVVPFALSGQIDPVTGIVVSPPHDVSQIVNSDLARSGEFDSIPSDRFLSLPSKPEDVRFKDWRVAKAEALVIGEIRSLGNDTYSIEARGYDVFREKMVVGRRFDEVPGNLLRKVSHQIADYIYEAMTGRPGAFDTQIAYVTVERLGQGLVNNYLRVADSDGYGPRTVFQSSNSIISPSWSPDATRLAYVSFEANRSQIVVQDVNSPERNVVASFKGINGAPAWSPDGNFLAYTSSTSGNADIYVMDMTTRTRQQITKHWAIDTEAAWSPDGQSLVFTSDRSGNPHIYRIDRDGSRLERLTFNGKYNARASYSPNGQSLVMISRPNKQFHVAIMDLATGEQKSLTGGEVSLVESPSFAPNGAMILYAAQKEYNGILAAVSADGRVKQELRFQNGDVKEPAWSPSGPRF
ncbi:MAG: Tol-Pal system beta propeller repeat protein TolB [Arenicellaceae bacterium]|nr:Tol-Pal system beta propeller repeat protein TolB [Arenicellaceae bacterium]